MNPKEELDFAFALYQRRMNDRDDIRAALSSAEHDVDVAVERLRAAAWRLREAESA